MGSEYLERGLAGPGRHHGIPSQLIPPLAPAGAVGGNISAPCLEEEGTAWDRGRGVKVVDWPHPSGHMLIHINHPGTLSDSVEGRRRSCRNSGGLWEGLGGTPETGRGQGSCPITEDGVSAHRLRPLDSRQIPFWKNKSPRRRPGKLG